MAKLAIVPLLVLILGSVKKATADGDVVMTMSGIVPPVFTPIDDEGGLNLAIIPAYAQYLSENGIQGVLISGTAGEGPTLTLRERMRLLDAWLSVARPLGMKVMIHVGGIPLPNIKKMARYAESVGVDAIMTVPELYYKPKTVAELVYFMECIASAAPNTPLLYYHIPAYTYVDVDMLEFLEVATREIPSFKGIKTEVYDTALLLRDKMVADQKLFMANSTYIAPAALMGFENFIMTEFSVFPQLMKNIILESQCCELGNARSLYQELQDIKSIITAQGRSSFFGLPAMKTAMTLVTGINVGPIRDPEIPLTELQIEQMQTSLLTMGIELRGASGDFLINPVD